MSMVATNGHSLKTGQQNQPLSEIIRLMVATPRPPFTLGEISAMLADRSMGGLLAFFAAINMLPTPPGTSLITGIPIVFIALHLIFSWRRIWLPQGLFKREISNERMTVIAGKLIPAFQKIERLLKPRYWPFSRASGDQVIGLMALILGLVVVFPIPLGNWLPACSVFLLGFSLSEKDGIWLALGSILAIISLIIALAVVSGSYAAAAMLIDRVF